jgi:hypothetical protein
VAKAVVMRFLAYSQSLPMNVERGRFRCPPVPEIGRSYHQWLL